MASQNENYERLDVNKCKVRELKKFLRDRGEFVSGNKAELIERAKGALEICRKPLTAVNEADEKRRQQRCLEKLRTPFGEALPDPTLLKDWSDCIEEIPSITEKDLYNYLVLNSERTFDQEEMKATRALKAKVFFKDGHVHSVKYHPITKNCSHCFVKCQVIPSVPTQDENKNPDYSVWLCMAKVSGQIYSAGCNCSAGEGESCSHIAGMLYGLVDLSEKKVDGLHSSTSTECWWMKPSKKRKISPKRSQDLTFKKHKFNDKSNIDNCKSKNKSPFVCTPVNIESFSEKLSKVNKHAAWLYTNANSISNVVNLPPKREIPMLHHNINFMYSDKIDLSSTPCTTHFESYFNSLKITDDDSRIIEEVTQGQSTNSDWHACRRGRLTSSNFGTICKRKDDTPPDCLVQSLIYSDVDSFYDGPSVRWGRSHERAALRTYENTMKKNHDNFSLKFSGLCVNINFPHLASSPDGLVSCKCCGQGLVEVKCPYKWRFKTPVEACADSDYYCVMQEGQIKLKMSHNYYFQVQGQMAVCEKKSCDFFVWTLKGYSSERIYFNSKFWEQCVAKLNSFYLNFIIPELFSQRIKRGLKLL